ncbi:glycosyltransferase family 4 protein [Dermacoccus nishinomiyaensis]|uniref:glycosyltransferase family 4 protein n=1 Tax=Dermacoccus nishinomiyaensis TaxID=1274 RepID=UPI000E1C28B8
MLRSSWRGLDGLPASSAWRVRGARRGTSVVRACSASFRWIRASTRPGAIQDERRVSSAIHRLGDSVTCPGWMDRNDFFSAIDLAVFPSTWAEPFGLVAAEAMGARCPFVVSDSGALPEVVGADYPFVARAGDAEDLARTLTAGLDAPWSEMLTASYERWEALFSPEAGRGRLATLLQSLPTSTRGVVTA